MITKAEVVGKDKKWHFNIYYDRAYPNIVSAAYETKKGAVEAMQKYISTGELEFYPKKRKR